ncbi:hypothetical protein B0H16DRAFT_1819997 [Mycena metata]|uniref:Uncharacterized protein n=1 Tax=Mycena metata TaxID=1033252 RepID=A0AAD7H3R7_9AGAR|nr:hypothetical protein B0H16DRAFT_1819997 [Mycena metata]
MSSHSIATGPSPASTPLSNYPDEEGREGTYEAIARIHPKCGLDLTATATSTTRMVHWGGTSRAMGSRPACVETIARTPRSKPFAPGALEEQGAAPYRHKPDATSVRIAMEAKEGGLTLLDKGVEDVVAARKLPEEVQERLSVLATLPVASGKGEEAGKTDAHIALHSIVSRFAIGVLCLRKRRSRTAPTTGRARRRGAKHREAERKRDGVVGAGTGAAGVSAGI